jgi:hypothetical protein
VVRALPDHFTVDPLTKPVPLTVRVKLALPAVTEFGLRLVIASAVLTVNVAGADAAPPVLATVTLAVPALAMSAAGTEAVTCVAETKVVVRAVPFQFTVEPLTNPEPVTVRVKVGPPAVAEFGDRLVITGFTIADACKPANPRQVPTPVTKSQPGPAAYPLLPDVISRKLLVPRLAYMFVNSA